MIELLPEFPALRLHAAVDAASSPAVGQSVGGTTISSDFDAALRGAQLVIDFSHPAAADAHIESARAARVPLFLGTTGLSNGTRERAVQAARDIPVLIAANTSVGVALLADLVRRAAAALGPEFNIEITDVHHRHKLDAPSGTALVLAEAAAQARGTHYAVVQAAQPRGSAGPRSDAEIGIASLRGGDVVGDHEVLFLGPGERLVLKHSATDRSIFARGALRAALWLATRPAGGYQMSDVFSS
jgi:4-hydroxy-tetrahydrodipicolinate reductase